MTKNLGVDKIFLFSVIFLTAIGFAVFLSASMGILAKDSVQFSSITFKQAFFGIILGFVFCFIFSKINYKIFKKYALIFFIFSLLLVSLVFIPQIGLSLNGAKRWISIFGFSFQPVALLNLGFVVYWSAWLSFVKDKAQQFNYGPLPLSIILSIIGTLLLLQPDTDSFLVICFTGIVMLIVAGGKFRHIFLLGFVGILCLTVLAFSRPYIMSRIQSYFNPSVNSLSSGYQLQQSLIAVGSGQIFGRGFGQSIQKFKFLPESISDSIFAVLGEELGFVGCIFILCLFLFLVFRGFRIAIRSPDSFGGLLVIGIVIIIMFQSLINITSVLGIIPISGIPLAFFSQGGTAMFLVLAQIGIVLNVSKYVKN
ncbi:MAG: putative peptidoglycan glycosyltransferase FtsW [Candidatus Taylorbacteria bacterium]|nr:putative peptidoglycan glycosyltransferase FtsW [Candidatus Taylorbacteria bacterium]